MASNTTTDQTVDNEQLNQLKEEHEAKLQSTLEEIKTRESQVGQKFQEIQTRLETLRKAHGELASRERDLDEKIKQINEQVKYH